MYLWCFLPNGLPTKLFKAHFSQHCLGVSVFKDLNFKKCSLLFYKMPLGSLSIFPVQVRLLTGKAGLGILVLQEAVCGEVHGKPGRWAFNLEQPPGPSAALCTSEKEQKIGSLSVHTLWSAQTVVWQAERFLFTVFSAEIEPSGGQRPWDMMITGTWHWPSECSMNPRTTQDYHLAPSHLGIEVSPSLDRAKP